MIDRYTLTPRATELSIVLGVDVDDKFSSLYNAAPTQLLPVITSSEKERIAYFKWGLFSTLSNHRTPNHKLFNLPLELLLHKENYKSKVDKSRCVIPLDGFYSWERISKKQISPKYCFFKDKKIMMALGVWEESEHDDATFMMVTMSANKSIAHFQADMPALLSIQKAKMWLEDPQSVDLTTLLQQAATEEISYYPVSQHIQNISKNEEWFITPTPARTDQHGNFSLFSDM